MHSTVRKPKKNKRGCYQTSRFTFSIPAASGPLLYNAANGAVLQLRGTDATATATLLSGSTRIVEKGVLPSSLERDLLGSGMLVPLDCDELKPIRERYWRARAETPIALTITTTMDCNLGCYYCYEERSGAKLQARDIPAIVDLAESRLLASGKKSLHVDWYGGEPLLNADFLAGASCALQELCLQLRVHYSASIISNGTLWPDDPGSFVHEHRIRQVQISFDGLRAHHDKRRRYRSGRAPSADASSFDRAVALVDQLLYHVRVDVRFNMDRNNVGDLPGFLALMRERGWFDRPFPVVVQPARLAAYSEHSSFMRKSELSADEYDEWRSFVRDSVGGEVGVEESEAPDGFPFPRTSVCAALANDSVVVGAEGALYRCGLQVGEKQRTVGALAVDAATSTRLLPIMQEPSQDAAWWDAFDPTLQPKCSRCSFLPICWSGCPKKHLEGDTHAIDEQGAYWRRNLARLVASGLNLTLDRNIEFALEDQFRDSVPVVV